MMTDEERARFEEFKRSNPEIARALAAAEQVAESAEAEAALPPSPPQGLVLEGGIEYVHAYFNYVSTGGNWCGQAAVATLVDFHRRNPYNLPQPVHDDRTGRKHWENDTIVRRIAQDYPANVLFGVLGTNGDQIQRALSGLGFKAHLGYSGAGAIGWGDLWNSVKRWIGAGYPVICSLDCGKMGGQWFTAHWGVVHKIEGGRVWIAGWQHPTYVMSEGDFLAAWHCHFLPWPNNHATIFPEPR